MIKVLQTIATPVRLSLLIVAGSIELSMGIKINAYTREQQAKWTEFYSPQIMFM